MRNMIVKLKKNIKKQDRSLSHKNEKHDSRTKEKDKKLDRSHSNKNEKQKKRKRKHT